VSGRTAEARGFNSRQLHLFDYSEISVKVKKKVILWQTHLNEKSKFALSALMIFGNKLYSDSPIHLIYDTRNKETGTNKHFKEYLQTKIYGSALENKVNVDLAIVNDFSHQCFGLSAADFFSWAIFRKYERKDDSFFNIFQDKLHCEYKWV